MNGLTPEEVYKLDAWQKDAKVSAKAKTLPDRSPFLPLEE